MGENFFLPYINDIPQHWADRSAMGRFQMQFLPQGKRAYKLAKKRKIRNKTELPMMSTSEIVLTEGIKEFKLNFKPKTQSQPQSRQFPQDNLLE